MHERMKSAAAVALLLPSAFAYAEVEADFTYAVENGKVIILGRLPGSKFADSGEDTLMRSVRTTVCRLITVCLSSPAPARSRHAPRQRRTRGWVSSGSLRWSPSATPADA